MTSEETTKTVLVDWGKKSVPKTVGCLRAEQTQRKEKQGPVQTILEDSVLLRVVMWKGV